MWVSYTRLLVVFIETRRGVREEVWLTGRQRKVGASDAKLIVGDSRRLCDSDSSQYLMFSQMAVLLDSPSARVVNEVGRLVNSWSAGVAGRARDVEGEHAYVSIERP